MEKHQDLQSFSVVWRGQNFVVEMNQGATLKEFGDKLRELTHVEADTLRLLVPVEKNSKLLYPFSDEHSRMSLETASILKGKAIRMMGVPKGEVDEVLQKAKVDLRIAGFDEEEKRLKQRISRRSYNSPKLPQGNYIFCDFRTLSLPGIVLNPPASKALELLHKLASDPGIVAIMNKHRWRVGILTEMAPEGYVGISPQCILGFNKNHGEEISLRLRTDDLKGFRKYEKIKKTLLHELAHMVFSEHDSNFLALDSQLNKEAITLDWTKSRGHTLTGGIPSEQYDEEFDPDSNVVSSHKLGGRVSVLPTARAASANAAFARLADTSTPLSGSSVVPDPNINDIPNESKPNPDGCDGDDNFDKRLAILEPELDSAEADPNQPRDQNTEPLQMDLTSELPNHVSGTPGEECPSNSHPDEMQTEPDSGGLTIKSHSTEPDLDDPDNAMEYPNDVKFRKLRKSRTIHGNVGQAKTEALLVHAHSTIFLNVLDETRRPAKDIILHKNPSPLLSLLLASNYIVKSVLNREGADVRGGFVGAGGHTVAADAADLALLELSGYVKRVKILETGWQRSNLVLYHTNPLLIAIAPSWMSVSLLAI
ncbi:hypothetical protein SASPL_154010 [Salvia splendens]|uniref:WLM domain-containing protein n=1 Tax=Salvia splendens TaxID=180675 RepID=A0A8X8YY21_SALSN|nr:hypothetical protein SASPL_154010 [Salvia splendens]